MGQKARGFICFVFAFLIALLPIVDTNARSKRLSSDLEARLRYAYWWRADENICKNKNSTTDGSNVTIIGDSITEITAGGHTVNGAKHPDNHNDTNDFEELLPEAEIYAQWGKSFSTDGEGGESGLTILNNLIGSDELREILVFALGTNDNGSLTYDMVKEVVEKAGEDRTVVFMTMTDNGKPLVANNELVERAANDFESVVIADWAGAAGSNPNLYIDQNDTVHPSVHAGTKLFAEVIYEAISCTNITSSGYGENIDCGLSGENTNYAGDQVFSEAELQAIKENYPFYKEAAESVGIPWEVIAVIHSMEHGLRRDNPSNGQGAYQLYSYVKANSKFLPAGPISDEEFARQTKIAAEVIAGKARGLNLSTSNGIKKLFFLYNGAASAYKNQARALGYTQEEAENGEGSPYVMNRFDAKRDPTKGAENWGQIKTDGGGLVYPANTGFGAYVKYLALSGSCTATSGGIDISDANADSGIMGRYRALAKNINYRSNAGPISYVGCVDGTYNNCSAFTAWYINNYTGGTQVPNKQGSQFVSWLLNTYPGEYTDGGKIPAVGAVMSCGPYTGRSQDGWPNHTGVVLGINVEKDEIIIGEASCSHGYNSNWPNAHTYSLSKYTNNPSPYGPTYAYPNTFKGF